ncbi:hypothetical protein V6N13_142250 [Hibiscus sabdariffa]
MESDAQKQNNDDMIKLMAFKRISVSFDPHGALAKWSEDSPSPCSWRGVSCSRDGRVTVLNLSYSGLVGALHLPNLTALSSLRQLYLQGNSFTAVDLSSVSSCNLEALDLSSNVISNHLPEKSFFSTCNSLAYVNLSHNSILGGSLMFGPSLLQLDLSHNQISDSALLSYSLSSCQNLKFLNFSDNKLAGKLGLSSLSCKNLTVLDLSYNLFSGPIPPSLMPNSLVSLEHLDLSHNNFSDKFSTLNFGQCSNLTKLSLSHNILSDSEFPVSLRNCHLLQALDLSHVGLQDKIPGDLLGNLRNLKLLSLAYNQFVGQIPHELGQACGTLEELDLSSNKLIGGLPLAFTSCSSLQVLNLGNNLLSGDFLSAVVSNLPSLKSLFVPFNNISGSVPLSLTNCTQLQVLDLASNAFKGSIPRGFCSSSSLERILLANNYLSGSVPMELGNCKNLRSLDLSFNSMNGPIPINIWNLPYLSDLVMWANNITGEIPEGICVNGGNLETLILNNNLISGRIPESISKCSNMIWVSLSGNKLTGEIPSGFGNLPKLAILQLGNNSLTGQIPPELGKCQSLIWLDLNSNEISGGLPHELANQAGLVMPGRVSGKKFAFVRNEGGTACRGAGGLVEFEGIRPERLENFPMVHSCSSTRIYSGMTMYTFVNNGSMIYLDVSYNNLAGSIPENFGIMGYLQVLNLGHNKLTGNIPESFGGLKAIGVLDLSHNNLQGYLPGSLGTLSFLSDLDVSNNNLTGSIPTGGQLTTFPASRYENNSGLCGVPLPSCASAAHSTNLHSRNKKPPVAVVMVVGITFFIFSIIGLTIALYQVKRNQLKEEQREKYVESLPTSGSSIWKLSSVPEPLSINIATFEKPLRKLTFAHLLEATNGFSAESLIGSGGFGTPGYVPPEYYQSFRCTTKGDVYSYGVILLELLSGKRPINPSEFGDDNNLVGWAKQLHREKRVDEILDPQLMLKESGESELYHYLRIAFECLDDRPFRRPTMIQVMAMFKELQVDSESDILDGLSVKDNIIDES